MLTIGEERTHFGYDAVRDEYVDTENEGKGIGGGIILAICFLAIILFF